MQACGSLTLASPSRRGAAAFDHRELVHRQPVVRNDIGEVNQPDRVVLRAAIGSCVLNIDPVPQQLVKSPIGLNQRRCRHPQDLAQGLVPRVLGDGGVQPPDRLTQSTHQHHFAVGLPLPMGRGEGFCPEAGVAQFPEPFEGGLFDHGFGEGHGVKPAAKMAKPLESKALQSIGEPGNWTAKFIAKMPP